MFDLSIEQLLKLEVSPFALTPTSRRMEPGTSTYLTRREIEYSGARTLSELQEIFVPNAQVMRSLSDKRSLGYGGVNLNSGEQHAFAVNSRAMDANIFEGLPVEQTLPLLGDLQSVNVLQSSGSILYGPVALTAIVDAQTFTGLTFQGYDVKVRQNFIDELSSIEMRYGEKFTAQSGIFLYAGMAYKTGADQSDSPVVFGHDIELPGGITVAGGSDATVPFANDNYSATPAYKLHADYIDGAFRLWARYTRDGLEDIPKWGEIDSRYNAFPDLDVNELDDAVISNYNQFTLFSSYDQRVDGNKKLKYDLSFDTGHYETWLNVYDYQSYTLAHDESELYGKVLLNWEPAANHSLAFGADSALGWFNLNMDARIIYQSDEDAPPPPSASIDSWQTTAHGLMFEYQWRPTSQLHAFLGTRYDKHTYMDWTLSPRFAVVYAPSDTDTMKFIASRSAKRANDFLLREIAEIDPDALDMLELRYERRQTERLTLAASLFAEQYDAYSLSSDPDYPFSVDVFSVAGIQLEAGYRAGDYSFNASHAYTKLLDSDQSEYSSFVLFSSRPEGNGADIAAWSPHVTKLNAIMSATDKLTYNGSLVIYWGYDGLKELVQANSEGDEPTTLVGIYEGYDEAFGASMFLNLGAQYKIGDAWQARLDLYNVLGWLDPDLNKRNYNDVNSGSYRVEAPAIGLSLLYTL